MVLASAAQRVSSLFNHENLDQFGFAHPSFVPSEAMSRRSDEDLLLETALKAASWIPIVGGQVAGTAYINRGDGNFNAKTVRGNMAIAFMGPILFVIDLIVTIGRLLAKGLQLLSECSLPCILGGEGTPSAH